MASEINIFELAQLAEASYGSFDKLSPIEAVQNENDKLGAKMTFSEKLVARMEALRNPGIRRRY